MSRDYTGQRFNKLVVLSVAEPYIDKSGRRVKQYKCLCDCGNTRVVATSNLLNGNTKSCGCYRAPRKKMNLVGQAFGKLTVIAEGERHKGKHRVWICRCECGNVKSFLHSNLVNKDGPISCGCLRRNRNARPAIVTGNRYGMLTVIRKAPPPPREKVGHRSLWECKCDCGTEKIITADRLLSGHTRSCGCLKGKMRSGKRFGKLTLVSKAYPVRGMRYWNCRCDCGRELTVSIDTLFRASNICCECRNGPKPREDLTGRVFGRLTALMEVDPVIDSSGKKHLSWLCRCICGREVVVRDQNLKNKNTRSCGCLKRRPKNAAFAAIHS